MNRKYNSRTGGVMKRIATIGVLTFVIGVVGFKTVYGVTPLTPCVWPNTCVGV